MLFQGHVRSGSKIRGNMSKVARRIAFAVTAMAASAPAWAGPEGPQVVAGQANFRQFGGHTSITATNGAIINYWSFNIGPTESVRFNLPSSDSRVLNRITGPDPSVIAGRLDSNGIVYIMNPSGVYFRQGALVNVGQIYAGAAHLSDANFLSGNNHFTDITGGRVVNEGVINAEAAHLIGRIVSNPGTINAPGGLVTMSAGDDVLIGEAGGNIYVRINQKPAENPGTGGTGATGATGRGFGNPAGRENAAVSNTGSINAAGGSTVLAAGDMYGMAIFAGGNISARKIDVQGQGRGVVEVGGRLDASSNTPGQRGGQVNVTGEHVRLKNATLDASGPAGGGQVNVGGGFQGTGSLRRSETTYIDGSSTLRADGTDAGTAGGTVVAWSDRITGFYGTGSAQGGQGGAGGTVETSGKVYLDVRGAMIRAGAQDGVAGLWLLDPSNVTIQNAATTNATFSAATGAYTLDGDTAVVNAADISTALSAGANVTIHTNRAAGAQSGDITVVDSITSSSATNTTLRLQAANNIVVNVGADITASGAGQLDIQLAANDVTTQGGAGDTDPNTGAGSVTVNSNITTNGGDLTITNAAGSASTGIQTITLTGTTNLGSGALVATASTGAGGNVTLSGPVTAGSVSTTSRLLSLSGGTVDTTGDQFYRFTAAGTQGLTLGANTTLTSTAGSVTFGQTGDPVGTIRGTFSLTVNAATAINLNTNVGASSSRPTALSLTAPALNFSTGTINTNTGAQSYTGAVMISSNNFTFTAGNITFSSSLRGAVAGSTILQVNASGLATFNGDIGGGGGAFNQIQMSGAGGSITLNGGSVNTTGVQQYINAVTLGTDYTFTGSSVQFLSNVDGTAAGQQSLTVVGDAIISGSVGAGVGTALEFVDISGATTIEDAVISTGTQTYGGAVTLSGTDGTNRTLQGSTITFNSTVDAATAGSQGVDFTGNVVFNGAVGGTAAVGAISTTGGTTTIATSNVTTAAGLNTGDQTYGGAVVLGTANDTTVTLNSGAGTVTFSDTVNATTAGEQGLIVTGNAVISGAVGGAAALRSLSVSGTTGLGASVTTSASGGGSGNQTYTGDVDLAGANDTTHTLTGTTVSFGGAVNATTAGEQGIAVVGNASFGGNVGAGTALRDLSVSGATSIAGTVMTTSTAGGGSGTQTYTGAVTLNSGNDSTVTFSGSTVSFTGGVDGAAAGEQGIIVNGNAVFGANSGVAAALRSINVTGTAALNAGSIITSSTGGGTGNQTYGGATTLGAASVGLTGNTITFSSTLDAAVAGTQGLAVTGNAVFDGAVGGGAALGSVSVSGTTAINGGAVATSNAGGGTGNQTYTDTVTIGGANGSTTTLTSTGGLVTFSGIVEALAAAQQGLTVAGAALFGGNVGGTSALRSLSVTGAAQLTAGTTITTSDAQGGTGNQAYGAVTIAGTAGQNVTLSATSGTVTFNSTIDSASGGSRGLVVTASGDTTFSGTVGGTAALSHLQTNGGGSTLLGGGSITTNGATVVFDDAVTLTADTTISDSGGGITFNSTVDSDGTARALTLNTPGGGNISLVGNVGATNALLSLTTTTTTGQVLLGDGTNPFAASVTTNIDLGGSVRLNGDTTLTSTGAGSIRFRGTVNSFDATARDLVINTAGVTQFDANVGVTNALDTLSTDAAGTVQIGNATGGGVPVIGINTTGAAGVNFAEAVTLDSDVTITATGGTVTFGSTINSLNATARSLDVVASGATLFTGDIGTTNALDELATSGGGTTTFGVGAAGLTVSTTGSQTYGDSVVLDSGNGNTTTFTSTGGTVIFAGTLNGTAAGQQTLAITGDARFDAAVGGTTALAALSVSGATQIGGGAVTTQGNQTYTGAVTLAADTTLNAGTGDVLFSSTVNSLDATARDLTINTSGATTFGGNVGTTFALDAITTDAGGTTNINAATITSSGDQTYGDNVVLGVDATINAANVSFNGNLDGTTNNTEGLTINTPSSLGAVSFGGSIGGTTPLQFLNINGVLTLTADTTFVINSITLANIRSTGGAWNLTLTCSGDAAIGNTSNLDNSPAVNNLVSNGTGTTTLLAGSTIRTANSQTYSSTGGTLIGGTVGAEALLIAGAPGATIDFTGTIDSAAGGARGLSVVVSGGNSTFSGAIGGTAALSSLTTTGSGTATFSGGAITLTGGAATFNNAVILGADTTITNDTGNVLFLSTVDSDGTNRDLTINTTTGAIGLAADVGGTSALDQLSLTTTGGGIITFGAGDAGAFTVSTTGAILVCGPTTLSSDMTFTAANNAEIRFCSTIDSATANGRTLTVNTGGATRFDASIGSTNALGSITTDAAGSVQIGDNSGTGAATVAITTRDAGGINFGESALTLDADVTMSADTGPVMFAGTIDSLNATARALSVTTTGQTTFTADVGASNVLSTLTTLGGGAVVIGSGAGSILVSTSGAQSYTSSVLANVGAGNVLTFTAAAGGVTFAQTLDAFLAGIDAVSVTNDAVFSGDVGATNALASLAVGGLASIAGDVSTTNAGGGTGDQTYTGAVTLAGADDSTRTLSSTGGTVTFSSTLDATTTGEQGLLVQGNASFGGIVGGTAALRDLAVSGASAINTTAISTTNTGGGTGDQAFTGAVTFGTGDDSTITFNSGTGTVAFGAAVDGASAGEQSIVINGNASFMGDVGTTNALAALTVTGQTTLAGTAVNTTNAGGGTGTQTYGGNFILNSGDDSTATFTATGSSVNFNGGLSGTSAGEQAVVVNGDATIAGSTTVALASVTVTGNTTLGNGTIDTTNAGGGTGAQNYGSVTLTGAPGSITTLNATGGNITLGNVEAQADNGQNLVTNATGGGQTLFNGTVGATNALASLLVTGGASINTTSFRTTNAGGGTGDQTFNGTITFGTGNDSTITFDSTGGTVTFAGALEGQTAGEQAIVITGNASFGGAIGATTALASISVSGNTTINGSSVVTTNAGGGTGNQTYTGAVTFTSGMGSTFTFNTTGGTVAFGSTLDGSGAGFESVVITGNTTFGGIVGGTNALAALTVNGSASVNTTAINTTNAGGGTGNQTFTGLVTLGAPDDSTTTFTATGGTVDFQGGLTGTTAGEQSAAIAGNASFAGTTTTALGSLSVTGATTLANATLVTSNAGGSSGDQTYAGAVTLGGANDTSSTLNSTGGTVTFASTVNATTAGEQGLTIGGNAAFNGAVGGTTALRDLSVSGNSAINTPTITTTNAGGGTGNQTFTGAVAINTGAGVAGAGLTNSVTFTSTGGTVAFGSTVNSSGNGSETLAVVGNAAFAGAVGGTNRFFRTTVTGTSNVGNDISTTMGQLFAGAVTLSRAGGDNNGLSTFDGGAGPMTFQGNILGTASGAQGITIRTTGTMRFENGTATPNTLPSGDGQLNIFRDYQAPIGIGGSIGTNAVPLRSVILDTQRTTIPTVSTIVFAPNLTAANRVPDTLSGAVLDGTTFNIRATDLVRFGFRDKVISFGTLNISGIGGNSLNSAQIGDITSLRGIAITADQIAIQNRGVGQILGQSSGAPSNTVINNDQGVDFVGTSINFSVEPFFHNGDISNPTPIATADVISQRLLTLASPGAVGVTVPGYATVQDFGAGDLLTNFIDNGAPPVPSFLLPFDLRAQGPVNTSISNTIAAFVVVQPPDVLMDTQLDSALKAQLQEIGIAVRDLSPEESLEFLIGRSLYDDRLAGGNATSGAPVSAGRLAVELVIDLLKDFQALRADAEIYQEALRIVHAAFSETPEGQEDPFNAAAFRKFVIQSGNAEAIAALTRLEQLFTKVTNLAIGPNETRICKERIADFLRPSAMTSAQLVDTVESGTIAPPPAPAGEPAAPAETPAPTEPAPTEKPDLPDAGGAAPEVAPISG